MNKYFLNEKGITLTELLAALSLFAVVSALVMTVLFNVFLNSENISDNAQLRQDANLLISTLRSHYNQGDFEVCLNDNNSLLIDGQEVNSSMTSSIDELKLENGENSISTVNECMTVKADGTPLSIDLKLKNEARQTYSIFTTIEKPTELEIALQVFQTIEEPDPIVPPDKPELENYAEGGYCQNFDVDTKYAYDNHNQFIPDGCAMEITITGNAWISDDHHNTVEMKHNTAGFNVTGNLFVDPIFNIDNFHPMIIYGDALFNRKLELKNEGKLIATNIHASDEIVVGNRTRLEARQSIVVDRRFHILSQGHSIIGKNFIVNTVEAVNESIININGSASISDKLLAAHNSQLNIGENLIIDGDLEMYDNVKIIVEGNSRIDGDLILGGNSNLTIKGNFTITGEVKQDNNGNNGTIHVEGMTNFSNGKPPWLNLEH